MRVLIVDDDPELLELVQRALERDGHEISTCTAGEAALSALPILQPEILVVDLGLPGISGEVLIQRLRASDSRVAILVLTAQSAVSSRVQCLDDGADDYLSKPFAIAELRARIRALSRRVVTAPRKPIFRIGGVELDFGMRHAKVNGEAAPITAREWAILEALATQPGQVMARRELIQRVWNQVDDDSVAASLEVLVGRIRRKIGSELLRTVRGEGYALEVGEWQP